MTLESPRALPTPVESGQRTKADNTRKASIEEGFVTLGQMRNLAYAQQLKDGKEVCAANDIKQEELLANEGEGETFLQALVDHEHAESREAIHTIEHALNRRDSSDAKAIEPDVTQAKLAEHNEVLREQIKSAGDVSLITADENQSAVRLLKGATHGTAA